MQCCRSVQYTYGTTMWPTVNSVLCDSSLCTKALCWGLSQAGEEIQCISCVVRTVKWDDNENNEINHHKLSHNGHSNINKGHIEEWRQTKIRQNQETPANIFTSIITSVSCHGLLELIICFGRFVLYPGKSNYRCIYSIQYIIIRVWNTMYIFLPGWAQSMMLCETS